MLNSKNKQLKTSNSKYLNHSNISNCSNDTPKINKNKNFTSTNDYSNFSYSQSNYNNYINNKYKNKNRLLDDINTEINEIYNKSISNKNLYDKNQNNYKINYNYSNNNINLNSNTTMNNIPIYRRVNNNNINLNQNNFFDESNEKLFCNSTANYSNKLNFLRNKESSTNHTNSNNTYTTNTYEDNSNYYNNSNISRTGKNMETIEELHLAFVSMIQNSKRLVNIQENSNSDILFDNNPNSTVIKVEEKILN